MTVIAIHFAFKHNEAGIDLPYHNRIDKSGLMSELLVRSIDFAKKREFHQAEFWLEAAVNLHCETARRETVTPKTPHSRQIEDLCIHMQHHPAERYAVSFLARKCFLSADHFTRLFKTVKGCSPREYMIRCRIEYACELLQESSMTIADISAISGYQNIYFFSTQFKKVTGMAPGAYRKKIRPASRP